MTIAYTRLTASEAISQPQKKGFSHEQIPAPSTMALIFNRMGYRLRKVVKAKPQKAVRTRSGVKDASGETPRRLQVANGQNPRRR